MPTRHQDGDHPPSHGFELAASCLAGAVDVRLRTLGAGAADGLAWLSGRSSAAPLLGGLVRGRSVRDVAQVVAAAGLLSAGVRWAGLPPVTDVMRIYARGVEDVLGWWLRPGPPLPPWMDVSATEEQLVCRCVGLVGADLVAAGWARSSHELPRWLSGDEADSEAGREGGSYAAPESSTS
jgi:hypothetical protein